MLKYRKRKIETCGLQLRVKTLRDLEQRPGDLKAAKARGISAEAFPLFGIIWPSSEVLAKLLLAMDLEDKRVLEVGCGVALTSLILNARGVNVTAMDIHPMAGEMLEINTRLNGQSPIPFVDGSWGDDFNDLGRFDLMVAGDVLYEPKHVRTLPDFLDRHLKGDGSIVIVDPDRGQFDGFSERLRALGFVHEPMKAASDYAGTARRFFRP